MKEVDNLILMRGLKTLVVALEQIEEATLEYVEKSIQYECSIIAKQALSDIKNLDINFD